LITRVMENQKIPHCRKHSQNLIDKSSKESISMPSTHKYMTAHFPCF